MKTTHPSAFSLTELLVSLAVLALVAAIIMPRYVSLQFQAQDAVATQMASQLNGVYADWKASGGVVFGIPKGSLLLYFLSGQAGAANSVANGGATVADGGTSSAIRASLPPGTPNLNPAVTSPTDVVGAGDYLISYSSGQDSFAANPAKSLSWALVGTVGPLNFSGTVLPSTYNLSYAGVSFGNPNTSNGSGSLYAYSGGSIYRADFTVYSYVIVEKNPAYFVKVSANIYMATQTN